MDSEQGRQFLSADFQPALRWSLRQGHEALSVSSLHVEWDWEFSTLIDSIHLTPPDSCLFFVRSQAVAFGFHIAIWCRHVARIKIIDISENNFPFLASTELIAQALLLAACNGASFVKFFFVCLRLRNYGTEVVFVRGPLATQEMPEQLVDSIANKAI